MRPFSIRSALLALLAAAPLACTALLGDFTVGATADGGGAGGDGAVDGASDGGSNNDAADGQTPVKVLTCKESLTQKRFFVGTLTGGGNNAPDRIFAYTLNPQGRTRVVGIDSVGNFNAFTFDAQSGNPNITVGVGAQGRFISIQRYPSGIAVLALLNNRLVVTTIGDGANAWSIPVDVLEVNALPASYCRFNASFSVLDAQAGEFFVAVSFGTTQACDDQKLFAAHPKGGPAPLTAWPLPPNAKNIDLPIDAIVRDPGKTRTVATVDQGGNGPSPGSAPVVYVSDFEKNPTFKRLSVQNPAADIVAPMAFTNSAVPLEANVSFLGGDLINNTGVKIWVGHVPTNELENLAVQSRLAATAVTSIADLPVDKARQHWEAFALPTPSENLLAMSRRDTGGANFYWWDRDGRPHAVQTGQGALFPNDVVFALDATFSSGPLPALGEFTFVFVKQDADSGANYAIYAAHVSCL